MRSSGVNILEKIGEICDLKGARNRSQFAPPRPEFSPREDVNIVKKVCSGTKEEREEGVVQHMGDAEKDLDDPHAECIKLESVNAK